MVVVTGASGFVGTALVAHFRARQRGFVGTVRHAGNAAVTELRTVGDLASASELALDNLLRDASAIVHLAGRAHVMEASGDAEYIHANTESTARLARAAVKRGVPRFVLASSVKVNGESSSRPFRPDDAPDPRDAYARSKLAAERALREATEGSPTAAVALRLPLLYGPGAKGNFARLLRAVRARRLLPVGAIRNRRSLLYVGNLVEAIDALLDTPTALTGAQFVADAEPVSTPELVRAIASAWRVEPRILSVPVPLFRFAGMLAGKGDGVTRLTGSLEIDTSSFREATGWAPRWSLAEALAQTASVEARSL